MNALKLFILAPLLASLQAHAAPLQEFLQEDFPYKFLAAKSVSLCPGTKIRVLSVGRIHGISPGGDHGKQWLFTDDQLNAMPFTPKINYRSAMEASFAGVDIRKTLAYGASLTKSIHPYIQLMEQLPIRHSEISVCISRLDISSYDQNLETGTHALFDLGLQVFLSSDTSQGRQTLLVEELRGQAKAGSNDFYTVINWKVNSTPFLKPAWNYLNKVLPGFLNEVPNEEASKNRNAISVELGQFFGGEQ